MRENPKLQTLPIPASIEGYEDLNPLQQLAANNAHRAISKAIQFGLLDGDSIGGLKTLDFGPGMGGSTWYLAKIGCDVTSVDLQDTGRINDLGVISPEKVVCGDGIQLMNNAPNQYGLINATMFGPDTQGHLSDAFVNAARHAIKDDGIILAFSEIGSLDTLKRKAGDGAVKLDNNTLYITPKALDSRGTFESTPFNYPALDDPFAHTNFIKIPLPIPFDPNLVEKISALLKDLPEKQDD